MSTRKLEVVFIGNTSSLDRAFGRVRGEAAGLSAAFTRTGKNIQHVGHTMTRNISAPLALIAGASIKAATDFDKLMERIHTQAGASQKEVERLKDAVLELSKGLPQSPQELAKGLYHLESIGLRGAKAMDALKVAALGAAVGGAHLEDVATALGSAWLVNIRGAGSFHHTMATLNAIVGTGNMKMEDLVAALGTGILPMAKEAGLSLQNVGAAIALLSDEGWPAVKAARLLGTSLHYLYAPSQKSAKALKSIGLTGLDLAKAMRGPEGLLGALRLLKTHLDQLPGGAGGAKAAQLLSSILPAGRGKVLVTLLNQLDRYDMKLGRVAKNTKHYSEQVAKTQETAQFRIQRAWDGVQASAIKLGDALLPIFVPLFEHLTSLLAMVTDAFVALPGPMKNIIATVGILAMAAGPFVVIVGKWIESFGFLLKVLPMVSKALIFLRARALIGLVSAVIRFGGALEALGPIASVAFGPIGIAIMAVVGLAVLMATHWKQTKAVLSAVWGALKTAASAVFHAIGWAMKHGLLGPIPFIITRWHDLPGIFSDVLHAILGALKAAGAAFLKGGKWIVTQLVNGIKSMPAALGDAAGWLIGEFILLQYQLAAHVVKAGIWIVKRIVQGVKAAPGALANAASWLVGRVVAFVHNGVGRLLSLGSWLVAKLVSGIENAPGAIASAASWIVGRVVQFVHNGVGRMIDLGVWLVHRATDGIRHAPGAIADAGAWLVGRVVAFVHDGSGRVLDLGRWIGHKIMDGLLAIPKAIVHAASTFVGHLIDAVKSKLGIHSPSRVFHEIGTHVIAGLIRGMHAGDLLKFAEAHVGDFMAIVRALLTKGLLKLPGIPLKLGLKLAKGGLGMLKGAISGMFSDKLPAHLGKAQVLQWLATALQITGHYSVGNLRALYGRTMQESGGNPRAINLWDSNAKAGHPSKGLLQTIPGTFARYRIAGLGDIWNPIANAVAAIRYMYANYGHIVGPSSTGYASGGRIPGFGLRRVRVGELGPEDAYLPAGTRITPASQSKHRDGPLIGTVNIYDQADERVLARELAWQIATGG